MAEGNFTIVRYAMPGRACYGMESGMKWKENFGMEDAQNGMEDLKNRMEDRLPY